jgi:glycosyltransferase involved in cell wall biosynthesis
VKNLLHILAGMDRGGCEGNAISLIQASPEVLHHVLVLGGVGPMSGEFSTRSVSIRHDEVLGRGYGKTVESVGRAAVETKADGVIVWHGMVALPEILHALRDFRGEVLVHGGNPAHSMRRSVDLRHWLREQWLGRRAAATYVCCSRHVADSFDGSLYLRRFPRVVVPNGVLAPTGPTHVAREILPGDTFTIGMVARLDPIKDHPTLLRSFSIVLQEAPGARLELAGDGPSRDSLEALAKELGIADQTRFLGSVADVFATMAGWDIFAYTTTDREGLGNALAEAMRFGLPCIASDVAPIRELGGSEIVYVPPRQDRILASAILALSASVERRSAIGFSGRCRAECRFSPERYATRYLELLKLVDAASVDVE